MTANMATLQVHHVLQIVTNTRLHLRCCALQTDEVKKQEQLVHEPGALHTRPDPKPDDTLETQATQGLSPPALIQGLRQPPTARRAASAVGTLRAPHSAA